MTASMRKIHNMQLRIALCFGIPRCVGILALGILSLGSAGCAKNDPQELEQRFYVMRVVQSADAAERDARQSAKDVEEIRARLSQADLLITDAKIARMSAERARAHAASRLRTQR